MTTFMNNAQNSNYEYLRFLATRTIHYTPESFRSVYTYKAKQENVEAKIKRLQEAVNIVTDETKSQTQKVISIHKIYKSKAFFERDIKILESHLDTDTNLKDYSKLIEFIREYLEKIEAKGQNEPNGTIDKDVALFVRQQQALANPRYETAYNVIMLYNTSYASNPEDFDEDIFCQQQGISLRELRESAKLIKELWKLEYQKYQEISNSNINKKITKIKFSLIQIVNILKEQKITGIVTVKPSIILARMPFKDIYDEEEFKMYALAIKPELGPKDAIEQTFNFAPLLSKIQEINSRNLRTPIPLNSFATKNHPDTQKGRVLAFAAANSFFSNESLEILKEFFESTNLIIEDSFQHGADPKRKLATTYRGNKLSTLSSKNICGFELKECQCDFTNPEEYDDVLLYMELFKIPYTIDAFLLVAQEYKNGIITKEEIKRLKRHKLKTKNNNQE